MKNAQDGMREKKESLKLFFPTRPFHHSIRLGPLTFRDPLLLCGVLYILLWMDAGGFLRAGLWADFCGPGCGRPFSMRWVICWPTG